MTNHQQQLVHPLRVGTVAKTHYPNRISIANEVVVYDADNEPIITYVDDLTLVDVFAYIEPLRVLRGREIRRPDETIVNSPWQITLNGYFPTISEADQATDEVGNVFNILSIDTDAFHVQTTFVVEIIS